MPDLFQISAEELALAMSVAGAPDNAKALLETTFGPLSKEEAQGRLMAAGDSLAARSLLIIEGAKDPILDNKLDHIIRVLLAPAFSVKYDKGLAGQLHTLAYHFARDGIEVVEHTVQDGVAHQLREVEESAVAQRGTDFFTVPDTIPFDVKAIAVPLTLFNDVRSRAPKQPTTAWTLMEKAGLAPQHARLLVEDLRTNVYQGSVMRIEYQSNSRPFSEQGFLILQTRERTWLLSIIVEQDDTFIVPELASIQLFQSRVQELIRG